METIKTVIETTLESASELNAPAAPFSFVMPDELRVLLLVIIICLILIFAALLLGSFFRR